MTQESFEKQVLQQLQQLNQGQVELQDSVSRLPTRI